MRRKQPGWVVLCAEKSFRLALHHALIALCAIEYLWERQKLGLDAFCAIKLEENPTFGRFSFDSIVQNATEYLM